MIGDHIRARKDGRWSHGIDCGDETIIHLVDDPAVPAADRVKRSYRPEFVAGAEAVEVVTHRERTYTPRQVVARAYSPRQDPARASMFKDSESFAAWCKTGRVLDAPRNVALEVPGVAPATAPAPRANGAEGEASPPPAARPTTARPKAPPRKAAAKATAKVKASAARPAKKAPAVTSKTKANAKAGKAAAPAKRATAKAAKKPAPAKASGAKRKPSAPKPAARAARKGASRKPARRGKR